MAVRNQKETGEADRQDRQADTDRHFNRDRPDTDRHFKTETDQTQTDILTDRQTF